MQKRGVICDAEDFTGLTKTYPKHPISSVEPAHTSLTNLKADRKQRYRSDVEKNQAAFAKKLKAAEPEHARPEDAEGYCADPPFKTKSSKYDTLAKSARVKVNLTTVTHEPHFCHKEPSLEWKYKPDHKSR